MQLTAVAKSFIPSAVSSALSLVSAILLALAFPDFEIWPLATVALVPLFVAIDREKESVRRSFSVGWIVGTVFFFGTCWWLTFAPITYAGLPWPPVYFLMFLAAAGAGIFIAFFAAMLGFAWQRFGFLSIWLAPLFWVAAEFLRMWVSGNNWNAVGYAFAFARVWATGLASYGGVYSVSFAAVAVNVLIFNLIAFRRSIAALRNPARRPGIETGAAVAAVVLIGVSAIMFWPHFRETTFKPDGEVNVIAVQPNVPMDGLSMNRYKELLHEHVNLAEQSLKLRAEVSKPTVVIFPESPMMFQYGDDEELREFFRVFADRNRTAVLFNSAERAPDGEQIMNSAVMVNDSGAKVGQYDKIFLLPFGEFIPFPEPVASWMPAFVGRFKKGNEYDLLPVGHLKAGVMICFESHFGGLSAEYARSGADMLIEMTNDGYLGRTPVLRQHLANAVFRAIETRLPVARVTNVGITAFINGDGDVFDVPEPYSQSSRFWAFSRADHPPTFYARIGDAFAITMSVLAIAVLFIAWRRKSPMQTD